MQRGSGDFEVLDKENMKVLVNGNISVPDSIEKEFVPLSSFKGPGTLLSTEDIYMEFKQRGYNFSGAFKTIASIDVNEKGL